MLCFATTADAASISSSISAISAKLPTVQTALCCSDVPAGENVHLVRLRRLPGDDADRDLLQPKIDDGSNWGFDHATCNRACQAYTYFALQHGVQCYCDDTYGTPAQQYPRLPDVRCHMEGYCATCGSGYSNSVFVVSPLPPQPPPNVLFIMVDDLAPLLGTYGRQSGFAPAITPIIDQFAVEGSLFETAYAQVPMCGASRASLMTSLYSTPIRFNQWDSWAQFDAPGVPDLPKVLRSKGYRTISNGKIYHEHADNAGSFHEVCIFCQQCVGSSDSISSCPYRGNTKSWTQKCNWKLSCSGRHDRFDPLAENRSTVSLLTRPSGPGGRVGGTSPAYEAADVDDWTYPDGVMTEKVIGDIRRAHEDGGPFFITAGFNRPHLPFACPKRYWDMYQRSELRLASNPWLPEGAPIRSIHYKELTAYGDFLGEPIPTYNAGTGGPSGGAVNLPDELAKDLVHGYYACVSYVDALIGYLFAELKSFSAPPSPLRDAGSVTPRTMYDETIITFTSDHGYHLGNKGTWCKHSVYETSLHVPMIIKAPDFAPSRIAALVENLDLYPTILDLIGVPAPAHVQGTSMVPLLANSSAPSKPAIFARYRDSDTVRFADKQFTEFCKRPQCWSIETCTRSCETTSDKHYMLYDHSIDPDENKNRADLPAYSEVVREMRAALHAHKESRAPPL
ncbi:hypothetical protein EMIHUDRAFT_209682 [Emiliania huxleyi CCMP1516]|uniref:Sulfatase N-terminal domain-containing protein n=2 Tax=Emiliania huxleyi TaxID=2903 RepID=A0A0D3J2K0_EMIH1|nr:hypothetical protein EMIHUDRAFT_209682 [Emiliania huxleyi CCMP1516]EOD17735.1 hypothetical protein EMIHUDRAFT_209682 [Emiliania huxleyi CCMP1516]|eukprot:XP_005770164.1 hypothetical protein EMIHUDRAFT_209682 [Emiliania huxleyi CCMP1516]